MIVRKKVLFSLLCFALILGLAIPISPLAEASSRIIRVPNNYPTIQAAVDAASPGDTIIVRDGTYTENIDVNKSLTIQSASGADSTIVQAANPNDYVFEVRANYVNISGFTVEGATETGQAGIFLYRADDCNISNNRLSNNFNGITLIDSRKTIVRSNVANLNGHMGIWLWDASNNRVIDNVANLNYYYGIYLSSGSENEIARNNLDSNGYGGIELDSSNSNTVASNTAESHSLWGIILWDSSNNIVITNNVGTNNIGIRVDSSNNNRIYSNNFIDNNNSVLSSGSTNTWNSPEAITYTYGSTYTNYLGNYWSDYCIYLPAVGHNDPDDQWEDETLAYDENRNTYARVYVTSIDTSWLELLAPPGESTQGIRFWGSGGPLRVDIYYDGNWHCLKDWPWGISSAPSNEWVELTYPSKIVEKARIKFHGRVLRGWSHLSEFQFKPVLDKSVFDVDGDGIGDRPYSIDGDKDNYPLMEPFENYRIIPRPPTASLSVKAAENARDVIGAPYLWGAKGRHWDSVQGHSAGEARWATAQEIKQTGYRWKQDAPIEPGIDCSGLIMWAYDRAYNPTGKYFDPANPVLKEGAREQWRDTARMEQRFTFVGQNAVTQFLNQYKANAARFGLLSGDPIYFLDPRAGIAEGHVVMYVGNGHIIHASGYHGKVVYEELETALVRYTSGGDWFCLVGLGRVRKHLLPIRQAD